MTNLAKKVLVVEDDIALCQSLKIIVGTLGVEVIDCATGGSALDVLENDDVSLVLCDIGLPDISGYDVLKHVTGSADLRHIPVVLLTAYTDESDVREGLALGAKAYVTKPFSACELQQMLREIITGI